MKCRNHEFKSINQNRQWLQSNKGSQEQAANPYRNPLRKLSMDDRVWILI